MPRPALDRTHQEVTGVRTTGYAARCWRERFNRAQPQARKLEYLYFWLERLVSARIYYGAMCQTLVMRDADVWRLINKLSQARGLPRLSYEEWDRFIKGQIPPDPHSTRLLQSFVPPDVVLNYPYRGSAGWG